MLFANSFSSVFDSGYMLFCGSVDFSIIVMWATIYNSCSESSDEHERSSLRNVSNDAVVLVVINLSNESAMEAGKSTFSGNGFSFKRT